MITYKGQKTVIGKRFFYESKVITYEGKIYGDQHLFKDSDTEYILSESELIKLKEYNINGEDTNTIKDVDNDSVLRNLILDYTDKEIDLLSDIIAGKSDDIEALNELYQNEYDELVFLNKYDLPDNGNNNVSLAMQLNYLKQVNRNISGVNIITLLASLRDFINSNKGGNNNGTV